LSRVAARKPDSTVCRNARVVRRPPPVRNWS